MTESNEIISFDNSGKPLISFSAHGVVGIAFDLSGKLYYSNFSNSEIMLISPPFNVNTPQLFTSMNVNTPRSIAFDTLGNLYVANRGTNDVTYYTSNGTFIDTYFSSNMSPFRPEGMAFDPTHPQNLYVSDFHNSAIFCITAQNTGSVISVTPLEAGAQLNGPVGLAFDSSGNLFVANNSMGNILKLNNQGNNNWNASVYFSGVDSAEGIAFDASDNLYVSNDGGKIIKITSEGSGGVFVNSGLTASNYIAFNMAPILFPPPPPPVSAVLYYITVESLRIIIVYILTNGMGHITIFLETIIVYDAGVPLSAAYISSTDIIQVTLDPCDPCQQELICNFTLFKEAVSTITPNVQLVLSSDGCCNGC